MVYTFSIKSCPHCNKTIDWSFKAGRTDKSKIGETEIYRCKHCGKAITNGLKEWPEMSDDEKATEKFRFFCGCFSMGLWGVGVVYGLSLFIEPLQSLVPWGLLVGFIAVASLVAFGCKTIINESIERYNKKQNQSLKEIKVFDAISLDISDDMEIIKYKLNVLSNKINLLRKNINVLTPDAIKDDSIGIMIMNLTEVENSFKDYYDKYGAIFLRLNFEQMAHYINTRNIETMDIPDIVKNIDETMEQILKSLYSKIDNNSSTFREMTYFFRQYKERMVDLKTQLVAAQTTFTISGTSPIDEDEILKLFRFERSQLLSKKDLSVLNDEYDKFMAEIEVNNL
jgi:DNA-directed RNA polymerase subunit N (RpoN/RPB10)